MLQYQHNASTINWWVELLEYWVRHGSGTHPSIEMEVRLIEVVGDEK